VKIIYKRHQQSEVSPLIYGFISLVKNSASILKL